MSLLGLAITKKDQKDKSGSVFVEFHQCDRCGAEYRVYLKSQEQVEEAFQAIAKMLGNKPDEQDLCFNCQSQVIANQTILPMRV